MGLEFGVWMPETQETATMRHRLRRQYTTYEYSPVCRYFSCVHEAAYFYMCGYCALVQKFQAVSAAYTRLVASEETDDTISTVSCQ